VVETIESAEFLEEVVPAKSGGTLFVRSSRGTVDVRTHDLEEVRVEAEARGRNAERVIFTLEHAGDDVRFEVHTEGWLTGLFGGIDVRSRIWVPRQYSLVLRSSGGDARVDGITGNVDLQTSGGDTTVSRITGRAGIHTSGGNLELEHLDGCVRARSSGGTTLLRDVFGDADVRTSGGNLQIDGIDGCVEARLSGGNTSIVFLGNPSGDIRSNGGSVDVRLHEDANFDLDAKSNGGKVHLDVELDREWQKEKHRVYGRRGQRGARLKIRTNGGDVHVGLV